MSLSKDRRAHREWNGIEWLNQNTSSARVVCPSSLFHSPIERGLKFLRVLSEGGFHFLYVAEEGGCALLLKNL